jgi:hypothetical protein
MVGCKFHLKKESLEQSHPHPSLALRQIEGPTPHNRPRRVRNPRRKQKSFRSSKISTSRTTNPWVIQSRLWRGPFWSQESNKSKFIARFAPSKAIKPAKSRHIKSRIQIRWPSTRSTVLWSHSPVVLSRLGRHRSASLGPKSWRMDQLSRVRRASRRTACDRLWAIMNMLI